MDRFEHLAKAYRVRLEDGQWLVKKVGGKPSFFPAKDDAGVDPAAHRNQPEEAVGAVRKFLSGHRPGIVIPGQKRILNLYRDFVSELPTLLSAVGQDRESLTFAEFRDYVVRYVNFR